MSAAAEFAPGDRVKVEFPDGWVAGTFVRYVSSTDEREDLRRLDVMLDEPGRAVRGAHSDCVRPAGEVLP